MKKVHEKQILSLIMSKLGPDNMDPLFGKDDISMVSLNKIVKMYKQRIFLSNYLRYVSRTY